MAQLVIPDVATRPRADDILDQHFGEEEIGRVTGMGWHTLMLFMRCRRLSFLSSICNLRKKAPSDALDIGTLFHASMARHYLTGGQETWKPYEIVLPHVPTVAAEVRRLLVAYFNRYGKEEAETLDVRAVEYPIAAKLKAEYPQPGKKTKRLRPQVTCRLDLIGAEKAKDAPASPYGPVEQGVYLIDHKTASALRRDYIQGFGMDGQLLQQALLYKRARLDRIFGPLNGFVVNVIVKTKEVQFERLRLVISEEDILRFERCIAPFAVELAKRFKEPAKFDDLWAWPMNLAACKDVYGLCRFFDVCESHGNLVDVYYETKPGQPPLIPIENLTARLHEEHRTGVASEVVQPPAPTQTSAAAHYETVTDEPFNDPNAGAATIETPVLPSTDGSAAVQTVETPLPPPTTGARTGMRKDGLL